MQSFDNTFGGLADPGAPRLALSSRFWLVHAVLLDWRRIPFTCSYLPGKRFIFYSLTIAILAFAFFMAVGAALVTMARSNPLQTVVIVMILAAAAWLLRRHRLGSWGQAPLMFEDEFPDRVLELQL